MMADINQCFHPQKLIVLEIPHHFQNKASEQPKRAKKLEIR